MADHLKGRDPMVPTVKEGGRSIHLIPREEMRHAPKEGIITQVSRGRRQPPLLIIIITVIIFNVPKLKVSKE